MRQLAKTELETKKMFLCEYGKAQEAVKRFELQLEELILQKVSPKSPLYDGMPGSKKHRDLSDYIVKVEALEQEIIQARYQRICFFQQVRASIEGMTDEREKTLLTCRYLKQMKWEEIADYMIFSLQHTHKIHVRALQHMTILQEAMEGDVVAVV